MEGMVIYPTLNGYTEAFVKRANTPLIKLEKAGLIILDVLLFLGGLALQSSLVSILGVAGAVGLYFLLPRFNIAWDYIYVDGQFDFDKIINGDARKHVLRTDLEKAELLAPIKEMEDYRRRPDVSVRNYSSCDPATEKYGLYVEEGINKMLIIFEPSQKMIDLAAQKAPRKVVKH